ncbi:MAG: cell division protein FtsA [Bacteroidaceae bacterium]|nr:cell division protein FtsA [Bacteroidaceae bacterium]MBQ8675530.1 cell division protein FtsA [Bacteroidaceae bacterium]MBQ9175579.1 cell division protein FtsA [Bacteroidaceae bacterium]MBR1378254.1 cell division protein FtsA [Bacteroidaceae bacterium]
MGEQESIIVAIELGSSKIAAIAGKKKDGTMQILAYAEEKTYDCVRRGMVYNIEKTTQSIRNVISRIEASLKMKVTRTYIGLAGQSVRSVKSIVKKNMLAPTYITQGHIDAITDESHEVAIDDYELIGFFTQSFTLDSNTLSNPVGIMGTNIEGEFLNIIANNRLRSNIKTSFENLGLDIADYRISAFELANNLLTDAEKRSGAAMVDFGAGTTTIAVLKNNIVRQITTLPIGINSIRQDLCDLQIEETEAEQLMLKYANAIVENTPNNENEKKPTYTTSDGREIEISLIQQIIEARLNEIIINVENQLHNSEYADKLLGGVVITGGGANIKNIDKACTNTLKIDKVRIARKLIPQLIKNSDITLLSTESATTCTIISLLLAGDENCVGEPYNGPDIFAVKDKEDEISAHKEAAAKRQKEEEEALNNIEETKTQLRNAILSMQKMGESINANPSNKKLWSSAEETATAATAIITDTYIQNKELLADKDKYKQSLREADVLTQKCEEEAENLLNTVKDAKKSNSTIGKLSRWIDDLLKE